MGVSYCFYTIFYAYAAAGKICFVFFKSKSNHQWFKKIDIYSIWQIYCNSPKQFEVWDNFDETW